MQYFVTGATGFIGRRLVKKLLARKGSVVHFLLRRESEDNCDQMLIKRLYAPVRRWDAIRTHLAGLESGMCFPNICCSRNPRRSREYLPRSRMATVELKF